MTLEFHKVSSQIDRMGEYLKDLDDENIDKIKVALEIIGNYSGEENLPAVHERVQLALSKDAGYRGARPLDESIEMAIAPAPLPETATLVATDGSQIPPNTHSAQVYYLINTGTIVFYHGSGDSPKIMSDPALFYEKQHTRLAQGGMISAATVAARRTVAEMMSLAEHTWYNRGDARPLIALLDNPLLLMGMGHEVPERDELRKIYFDAMTRLLDVRAGLAGYTDRPLSRYVVGMLHLLDLDPELVTRRKLTTDGRLEGLYDRFVFSMLLNPGERSALFVLMSPLNKEFKDEGGDTHEIAFFYINAAAVGQKPKIARVEIPMWVANDRELVNELQSLLYHQCQQVASRYPYILTRAHELAVVKHEEAKQLDVMIRVSMTRYGLEASDSEKQIGKDAVSGGRTRFSSR